MSEYTWCVVETKGNTVHFTCHRCQQKHVFSNNNMTIDRFIEISDSFCMIHKDCKENTTTKYTEGGTVAKKV